MSTQESWGLNQAAISAGDVCRVTVSQDAVRRKFRAWYRRDLTRLFRYVSYWVPDNAAAEDLTSAICERAFRHLHTYDPQRGEIAQWMYGIARNMLRTHHQMQSRVPTLVPLDSLPELEYIGSSPENLYEEADAFHEVLRNLYRLSIQEREAVSLRYGAGLMNHEIAEVMGISANQVGVVLYRALNKLRHALQMEERV